MWQISGDMFVPARFGGREGPAARRGLPVSGGLLRIFGKREWLN